MKPRLGRYKLLRKLAHGGMSQVYLARQVGVEGFAKKVVIKRLPAASADDAQLQEMFVSEAALAAHLDHPNVVSIIDFAEADGERFLVMEYVDGPSLKLLLERARASKRLLPIEHCLKIASWVCEGLAYVHSLRHERTGEPLSVVHRDITPDNILITRTGVVKIIDFGIAKATTQVHETQAGQLKGKLPYVAPEQLFADPIDRRADLFSLGVVLFEAITGVQPFARDSNAAVIDALLQYELPRVTSLRPDAPPALDAIVAKATAKKRDERFSNALELQALLEAELVKRMPVFVSGRLRELVALLDPPLPREEEEEDTTTDGEALVLAAAADDWDEKTDRVKSSHTRTKTSPKLEVPPGAVPLPQTVQLPPGSAPLIPAPQSVPHPIADEPEPVTASVNLPAGEGPPSRQGLPVLALFGLMVGTGVLTWFVSGWVNRPAPEDTRVVVAKVEAPPAAGPLTAVVEEPVDASVAAAPELPDASAPLPDAGAAVTFELGSVPVATLFVDGARAGDTPVKVALEPGTQHRLRFESPDAGLNKSVMLRVPREGPFEKQWEFERAVLTLEVPEGSEVWLDKRKLGTAPLAPVELWEGTHRVRVVNVEGSLDVSKTLELKAGATTERIGVD